MDSENVPSFNASRILPLSSNGVEARIEEKHEKKPKVSFSEAEPEHIDLSETQNVRESTGSCTELVKENLQPKVRRLFGIIHEK